MFLFFSAFLNVAWHCVNRVDMLMKFNPYLLLDNVMIFSVPLTGISNHDLM